MEVAARRGAVCNTDHHLVLVKLRLKRTLGGRLNRDVKSRRFDVEKLMVGDRGESGGGEEKSGDRGESGGGEEEIGVRGESGGGEE